MDDRELVAQIRAGDLDAASVLLARHEDAVYTVTLRIMGNVSDAEDIAQEALVRAYTHMADLQDGAGFAAWLRRIAINLSLNALRRRGHLRFESMDADAYPLKHEPLVATVEDSAIARAGQRDLEALLQTLPAEQRVAVVLRDVYRYEIAEIADLQKCGLSAAKMRIMRGRAALRVLVTAAERPQPRSGEKL